MSPLHLEIFLFYATRGDGDFELIDSNETRKQYALELVKAGVLEPNPVCPPPGYKGKLYAPTSKGHAWLEAILQTPFPVHRWIVPDRPPTL